MFEKRGKLPEKRESLHTVGAVIIRIGFWGILYYNSNKEPLKLALLII